MIEALDRAVHDFPFFTNHTYVLALIAQRPDIRMRDIANAVGITERAVQRIVEDLTVSRCIAVIKSGRRNSYVIQPDSLLHHPMTHHRSIGDLVRFVSPVAIGAE